MTLASTDETAARRIPAIDIARGVAVIGMFAYHFTWDLASFGFIARTVPFSPGFRLFSHVVASTFLFLAGFSLVLAQSTPFRWDRWRRHIATIAAAALLVTLASALLFPEGLIGFGILHCIALALLAATPFLFLPPAVAVAAAVAIAALPILVQSSVFNSAGLVWIGFGTIEPSSNDFRPFFPWAAPAFVGLAIAAFAKQSSVLSRFDLYGAESAIGRPLRWGGRHSLAIYLVHQPIFLGALSAVAFLFSPDAGHRRFVEPCIARCTASGGIAENCRPVCACTSREMEALDLRDRAVADRLDEAEKLIQSRVTQACLRSLR